MAINHYFTKTERNSMERKKYVKYRFIKKENKTKIANNNEEKLPDSLKELLQQIEKFQSRLRVENKVRLTDSMLINKEELKLVEVFFQKFKEIKKETDQEIFKLQMTLGSLLVISGDQEADNLLLEIQEKSGNLQEQGLAAYNRFVNFVSKGMYDNAFTAYQEALKIDSKEYQLFDIEEYAPKGILGAGGFGIVFLCEKEGEGEVVLKSLTDPKAEINDKILKEEVKALQKAACEYVIGLKDYGYKDKEKLKNPYIVTEYFPGKDLSVYLKHHKNFSIKRGIEIAKKIAIGMKQAHDKGIIHRDLKPANILYKENGDSFELKIIDFGLAIKEKGIDELAKGLKSLGNRSIIESAIAGTIKYAPPEQMGDSIAGRIWEIDKYSDIYSFGKTLKYMIFGKLTLHPRTLRKFSNLDFLDLIGDCESEIPINRPQNFEVILKRLDKIYKSLNNSSKQFSA